jgi:hypothetical protein
MHETPAMMARLQELLDHSARTAGARMKESFGDPNWRMSAQEFVDFWGAERMASIATAAQAVHAAALDIRLVNGVFHVPTYADAIRLADHKANSRCVITSWADSYHVAVVYGTAVVRGTPGMVDVAVTPTRIYAISPPSWHHAASKLKEMR